MNYRPRAVNLNVNDCTMSAKTTFTQSFLEALSDDRVVKRLYETITAPVQMDIKKLEESNKKALSEISKIKATTDGLRRDLQKTEDKIEKEEERTLKLETQVDSLNNKLENVLQTQKRNNVVIHGMEETRDGEDVKQKVINLLNVQLELGIDEQQILNTYRVGRQKIETTRPTPVAFATFDAKQRVMAAKNKLRTMPRCKIFLNEDLTSQRYSLLASARQLKKNKVIMDCWSYNGNILVKDKANIITRINTVADLDKFS